MSARLRAAVYVTAASIGAAALIYGWATSEQVEAWLKVIDSLLNLIVIVAPLLALKHLTPDLVPSVPGEVVDEAPVEPAGEEPSGD